MHGSDAAHAAETEAGVAMQTRIALLSIAGFWALYFVIASARSLVWDGPGQGYRLVARVAVCLISVAATGAIYWRLRRVSLLSPRRAILAAMALSIPAAAVYGIASGYVYTMWVDPLIAAVQAAARINNGVVVGAAEEQSSPLAEAIDNALNGYFFFVAWCGLYLALEYAALATTLEARAGRLRAAAQAAELQAERSYAAAKSAELRALRYQVNPHFLFNTLNSLSSLVLTQRNPEADRMINAISAFFRASLAGDPSEDVPLEDEISLQRLYLEIEAIRFGDRLRSDIAIPDDLMRACVPGLILQPLVENAIKHGVARTKQAVTVSIKASREGDLLTLQISDDAKLVGDPPPENGTGVGLSNVRERLIARFGAQADARWSSLPQGGYAVTLAMPLVFDGC